MNTFKEYLIEVEKQYSLLGSLNIFDIDDTLFHTTALIQVVKDGQVVKQLTNQEFNTYVLQPGEEYDFTQFRSSQKFNLESQPMTRMINKANAIIRNQRSPLSKTILLTAREDFDDKNLFLKTFRDHGFLINDVYVERAGNLPGKGSPASKKAIIVSEYLDSGNYRKVRMFDDSMSNLYAFLNLQKKYRDVSFEAYFVTHDGSIKTVK